MSHVNLEVKKKDTSVSLREHLTNKKRYQNSLAVTVMGVMELSTWIGKRMKTNNKTVVCIPHANTSTDSGNIRKATKPLGFLAGAFGRRKSGNMSARILKPYIGRLPPTTIDISSFCLFLMHRLLLWEPYAWPLSVTGLLSDRYTYKPKTARFTWCL